MSPPTGRSSTRGTRDGCGRAISDAYGRAPCGHIATELAQMEPSCGDTLSREGGGISPHPGWGTARVRATRFERGGRLVAAHEVTFPVTDPAEILKLRAGDEVIVQGHIIGIRDRTQNRIFHQGIKPPMDINGAFFLHTALDVRHHAPGMYEKLCIGKTTSARITRSTNA